MSVSDEAEFTGRRRDFEYDLNTLAVAAIDLEQSSNDIIATPPIRIYTQGLENVFLVHNVKLHT